MIVSCENNIRHSQDGSKAGVGSEEAGTAVEFLDQVVLPKMRNHQNEVNMEPSVVHGRIEDVVLCYCMSKNSVCN